MRSTWFSLCCGLATVGEPAEEFESLEADVADQVAEVVDHDGVVEARRVPGGEPVPALVCYWLAWVEFNPETELVDPR